MQALIFADNKYQQHRMGILRAPGAHRIATHLRNHGLDTEVVDFYLDWTLDELKLVIDTYLSKPTLFVGFSCSLMFDGTDNFKNIRDYIRATNPDVKIVIGGYGTTQKGFDGADFYLEGYSEYAILALVEHLKDNTQPIKYDLDEYNNKVIYTKELYPVNKLTSLDIKYIPSDFIKHNEVLSLETARGCIFKCKFCSFQLLGKSKLDYLRDADEIRNEIVNNYTNYGTTHYIVTEDTFNDTDQKVDMLYNIAMSLPFKLKFMGYVRADLLAAKPHNIDKMVEMGFTSMHFGIETFNDHAGQIIGKGMPSAKLKETLVNLKKKYPEVYINGTFIVGLPGETEQDIQDTANWILDSKTIDFWTFNPLMIPKKNKLIYSSEFTDNYLMYGYSKMTQEEISIAEVNHPQLLYGSKIIPYMILWKNKLFDYFSAATLSHELNQQANMHKKVDAWTTFAISSLGVDLNKTQQQTYSGINPLDQELVKQKTQEFVAQYKFDKISLLKNTK
jgi:lipoate synthase